MIFGETLWWILKMGWQLDHSGRHMQIEILTKNSWSSLSTCFLLPILMTSVYSITNTGKGIVRLIRKEGGTHERQDRCRDTVLASSYEVYTCDTRSWVLVKPFVFSLVLWVSVLKMLNIEDKFSSDSGTLCFSVLVTLHIRWNY